MHVLTKRFQLSSLDMYNVIQGDTAAFSKEHVHEFRRGDWDLLLFIKTACTRHESCRKMLVACYRTEFDSGGKVDTETFYVSICIAVVASLPIAVGSCTFGNSIQLCSWLVGQLQQLPLGVNYISSLQPKSFLIQLLVPGHEVNVIPGFNYFPGC